MNLFACPNNTAVNNMSNDRSFQFSTVLASTVHDIKNSLGVLQGLINSLSDHYREDDHPQFKQLAFEAKRMNHSMMQLLVLYKIDNKHFSLHIDEHDVQDILDDIQAQITPQLQQNTLQLTIDCEDGLLVFCDANQISNAVGTMLNNAQRYSKRQIRLSAFEEKGNVCLCIEDDGVGYPPQYLDINPQDTANIDWVSGNTGLGLYFTSVIASLHKNGTEQGYTKTDNQSSLGGARFRLYLP